MLDHIDHAVQVVGIDHVTIGTDRPYISCRAQEESAKVPARPGSRPRWEALWEVNDPVQTRRVASGAHVSEHGVGRIFPLFTVGMVQRGYADDDIRKILGGNILRVAREVLGEVGL